MREFTATAERSGRWWVVQCDQEPGAISQVAQLSQAVEHQREAISMVTDIREDEISVTVNPVLSDEARDLVAHADALAVAVEAMQQNAIAARRAAVLRLKEEGASLRDIGFILGISFQRAGQLAEESAAARDSEEGYWGALHQLLLQSSAHLSEQVRDYTPLFLPMAGRNIFLAFDDDDASLQRNFMKVDLFAKRDRERWGRTPEDDRDPVTRVKG